MKKKILFTLYDLSIGGISTSFLNMLNRLDLSKYDVTIILQKKEGLFLNSIPKDIHIINYNISKCKLVGISKIINRLKLLKATFLYKNKFDFAGCYFTYCVHSALICKMASKNNAIWIHTDLVDYCKYNNIKIKDFMERYNVLDYKNIFCVSKKAVESLKNIFIKEANKFKLYKNIINIDNIKKLSLESVNIKKAEIPTFLFVGRFDEKEKQLSYIIKSAKILHDEKYEFRVILVGDGQDKNKYLKLVNKYKLENYIKFILPTNNPYPYFRLANCFLLTSLYEGYPVVYSEAIILNVPIITTDVSDAKIDIDKIYGQVIKLTVNNLALAMKDIISQKFKYKQTNMIELENIKMLKILEEVMMGEI